MDADTYVSHAYRLILEEPPLHAEYSSSMEDFAKFLEQSLSQMTGFSTSPWTVKLIYAFNKTSSALKLGDESILIHNRFLCQAFQNLNKIFIFSKNTIPASCYIARLLEEEFYAQRKDDFALAVKEFRMDAKTDATLKKFLFGHPLSALPPYTPIQEHFLMAHEAMHLAFRNGWLDRQWIYKWVRDCLAKYADDIHNLINLNDTAAETFQSMGDMEEIVQEFSEDEFMLEELYCDVYAMIIINSYWQAEVGIRVSTDAVRLALRHMRLFTWLARGSQGKPFGSRRELQRDSARYFFSSWISGIIDLTDFESTQNLPEDYFSRIESVILNGGLIVEGTTTVLLDSVEFDFASNKYRFVRKKMPQKKGAIRHLFDRIFENL